jgi:hypothetical protein
MKVSKGRLDELIKLYLNDCEDYGNTQELVEAQSALLPIRMLLIESKDQEINMSLIRENLDSKLQPSFDDFIMFSKFIECDND